MKQPLTEQQLHEIIQEAIKHLLEDSSINIKPENKGKFTQTKKRTHKSTEELTHSKNPLTRKRAIFAQNAKKWNHNKTVNEDFSFNKHNQPTDLELLQQAKQILTQINDKYKNYTEHDWLDCTNPNTFELYDTTTQQIKQLNHFINLILQQ